MSDRYKIRNTILYQYTDRSFSFQRRRSFAKCIIHVQLWWLVILFFTPYKLYAYNIYYIYISVDCRYHLVNKQSCTILYISKGTHMMTYSHIKILTIKVKMTILLSLVII